MLQPQGCHVGVGGHRGHVAPVVLPRLEVHDCTAVREVSRMLATKSHKSPQSEDSAYTEYGLSKGSSVRTTTRSRHQSQRTVALRRCLAALEPDDVLAIQFLSVHQFARRSSIAPFSGAATLLSWSPRKAFVAFALRTPASLGSYFTRSLAAWTRSCSISP